MVECRGARGVHQPAAGGRDEAHDSQPQAARGARDADREDHRPLLGRPGAAARPVEGGLARDARRGGQADERRLPQQRDLVRLRRQAGPIQFDFNSILIRF